MDLNLCTIKSSFGMLSDFQSTLFLFSRITRTKGVFNLHRNVYGIIGRWLHIEYTQNVSVYMNYEGNICLLDYMIKLERANSNLENDYIVYISAYYYMYEGILLLT